LKKPENQGLLLFRNGGWSHLGDDQTTWANGSIFMRVAGSKCGFEEDELVGTRIFIRVAVRHRCGRECLRRLHGFVLAHAFFTGKERPL
jgi:hypothetical protein